MLETICDIKNNKKRSKEDPAHHTRIKKWLQKVLFSNLNGLAALFIHKMPLICLMLRDHVL